LNFYTTIDFIFNGTPIQFNGSPIKTPIVQVKITVCLFTVVELLKFHLIFQMVFQSKSTKLQLKSIPVVFNEDPLIGDNNVDSKKYEQTL
jgi:hypothetical protein